MAGAGGPLLPNEDDRPEAEGPGEGPAETMAEDREEEPAADEDEAPEDTARDRPQELAADEPEELREISDDELNSILEAHKAWVESKGQEGQRANLRHSNLEGAKLVDANLQGAH